MRYETLVFDCDGVVLNSNAVKTAAFRTAVLACGCNAEAADALAAYHVAHGGVSRFAKFDHFCTEIMPRHAPGSPIPTQDDLLASYAEAVEVGLLDCAIAPGLPDLRSATRQARWMIVSGGAQSELRYLFHRRGIDRYFDGGIFGSPDTKHEILTRELASGALRQPALFLGDSRYDHVAAQAAGLDFIFVSGWSEFADWQAYAAHEGFPAVEALAEVADLVT
ncbi:HAD family hydrolase [Salipiger aestuarii]|uniref:HAD family hydrolase n=1 Tax=Salipiger aestuarii TaxID=568098 RepID=UPI00123C6F23|nr:HAD family hydrolase [Salipiger aestuarii]KAA8606649.1 HAD family hydrolase [Salipiger aestuarii]